MRGACSSNRMVLPVWTKAVLHRWPLVWAEFKGLRRSGWQDSVTVDAATGCGVSSDSGWARVEPAPRSVGAAAISRGAWQLAGRGALQLARNHESHHLIGAWSGRGRGLLVLGAGGRRVGKTAAHTRGVEWFLDMQEAGKSARDEDCGRRAVRWKWAQGRALENPTPETAPQNQQRTARRRQTCGLAGPQGLPKNEAGVAPSQGGRCASCGRVDNGRAKPPSPPPTLKDGVHPQVTDGPLQGEVAEVAVTAFRRFCGRGFGGYVGGDGPSLAMVWRVCKGGAAMANRPMIRACSDVMPMRSSSSALGNEASSTRPRLGRPP
jgi:hypothetical protein